MKKVMIRKEEKSFYGCGLNASTSSHCSLYSLKWIILGCHQLDQEISEGDRVKAYCNGCYRIVARRQTEPDEKRMVKTLYP